METGEIRIINICANYIKNRLKYFLVMPLYVPTYIRTGLSINICIIMFKYYCMHLLFVIL